MNNSNTAILFDLQKGSVIDGPGIRTTVFFKGCNLRCKWCHNPESQRREKELMFYKNKCIDCGVCRTLCPHGLKYCDYCQTCTHYCPRHAREVVGKSYTSEELFAQIATDILFYQSSGGGVTFSGGECMLQADFLADVMVRCKQAQIHCAVDTAGCVPWESFEKVLPYADLFLYDLKCFSKELHKEGTGVSNERILENLCRLCSQTSKEILVRIPIIPGFNDRPEELRRMADFLRPLRISNVELLAYHRMGESKYLALGREPWPCRVPEEEEMEGFKALFG